MLSDLGYDIGTTLVYLGMGLALLTAGFYALDAVTPGKLGELIMGGGNGGRRPSINAGLLAAASMVATSLIVFTALWTNVHDGFGQSVLWTMVFGLIGVAAQALGFKIIDWLTPGDLGRALTEHDPLHGGTLLASAAQLAVALVVVVSIA